MSLAFGEFAAEYDAARPSYPSEALDWLLAGNDGLVVDVGAGSGKLTELLVARCPSVVAVEPDLEMLRCLQRRLPDARALQGPAESLPLPSGSARTILVAQAWHWFDVEAALGEFSRVAGRGASLGVLWNAPAPNADWQRELVAAGPTISPVHEDWWPRGFPEDQTESRVFHWADELRPEEICREHATHLAIRRLEPPVRERYLSRVLEIAAAEAEQLASGRVQYRRMTWCARRPVHAGGD